MVNPRIWIAAIALSAMLLGGSIVYAEVSAYVDPTGEYLGTVVSANASAKKLRIWGKLRGRHDLMSLNAHGDETGDLWPAIAENPLDRNHPWVVWSSFTGTDYDLRWSRWSDEGWAPLQWLDEDGPSIGDDLDPALALDSTGRVFVAWWRADQGVGQVYFSLFLESRWSQPWAVTSGAVDSRYPVVTVEQDTRIRIDFDTPDGPGTVWVRFNRPDTITDELNPFDQNTLSNETAPPDDEEFGR